MGQKFKDLQKAKVMMAAHFLVQMVKKYDHVVSSDLDYWLDYVGMKSAEFWETADTFRSEKVWWIKNGEWFKENLWGGSSAYGEVKLKKSMQEKYKRD